MLTYQYIFQVDIFMFFFSLPFQVECCLNALSSVPSPIRSISHFTQLCQWNGMIKAAMLVSQTLCGVSKEKGSSILLKGHGSSLNLRQESTCDKNMQTSILPTASRCIKKMHQERAPQGRGGNTDLWRKAKWLQSDSDATQNLHDQGQSTHCRRITTWFGK